MYLAATDRGGGGWQPTGVLVGDQLWQSIATAVVDDGGGRQQWWAMMGGGRLPMVGWWWLSTNGGWVLPTTRVAVVSLPVVIDK